MTAQATRVRGRGATSIKARLDPTNNSLNLVRLVLALTVIVHHTYPLAGFPERPAVLGVQIGGWAVDGFFCLSGYLITGSRRSRRLTDYLAHRAARIYPGFWVCLVVTAALIAPIDYARSHGGLDGYLTTGPVTPINYILVNATLRINSFALGNTLETVPYPSVWNGSLWTLYYEFLCYLLIAVLGLFRWWRDRAGTTAVLFGVSVVAAANVQTLSSYVANPHVTNFIELVPFFLGGSLIYMVRERVPMHWAGAVLSVLVIAVCAEALPTWGPKLAAPALAYLLLYIGTTLPSPRVIQRHDISYGVYIYAFPLQQILVVFGAATWGAAGFTVAAITLTIPLAIASWLVVERPAMQRARRATSPRDVAPVGPVDRSELR